MTTLLPKISNFDTHISFSQIVNLYNDDPASFHIYLRKYIYLTTKKLFQLELIKRNTRIVDKSDHLNYHLYLDQLDYDIHDISSDVYLDIVTNLDESQLITLTRLISLRISSRLINKFKSHSNSRTRSVDFSSSSDTHDENGAPIDPFYSQNLDHFTESNNEYTETTFDFIKSQTSTKQFDILLDKYVENLSYDEISAKRGVNPKSINNTLIRTIKKLRPLLLRTGHTPSTFNRERNLKIQPVVFRGKNPKPFN